MKLRKTTYRYELEDPNLEAVESLIYEVTPILGDLLRAELEGPKHGITNPTTQSIHTTVLWMWSAGLRAGQHDLAFPEFKSRCVNFEVVRDTEAEVQGVPPTSAGSPSGTHSSSPAPTDTPTPREPGSADSAAPTP